MKAQSLYLFAALFFVAGILFFLKGFFLTRVELPAKSGDSLDIYGAFNGLKQSTELSQRFLSKAVLDLGHSLTKDSSTIINSPYFSLFNAIGDDQHVIKTQDTSTTAISPIALLSTIHSMPNSIDQLFTPSKTQTGSISLDNRDQQTCSWFCRQYDQIFFIVVDALRFDFLQYNHTLSPDGNPPPISFDNPPYINRLSNLANYHNHNPTNSGFYKFRADTPTVTMQRLKALLTGSLPTFLDVKDNFAATTIQEDNLMEQVNKKNHHTVMVGDDTWMGLVGPLLTRPYPYPSFDVHDLDTVDNGCIYRIHHELCGRTLASMKLGLDEYFQQFIYDHKFDNGNNSQELDQLRKDAKELQRYIETTLHFEKDTLLSQSHLKSLNKESTPTSEAINYSIPSEINYSTISTTPSWFIAHFLGVDHVGHRFGPRHPLMDTKLRQMNEVLQQFLQYVDIYSDHTPQHTKPFLSVFQEQYDFVLEYCDKATTDPFSQKLTSIKRLIDKESKLNVAQFSTKSPLPRSVVYILGDHGMTEGGNHGGASLKETQAGFAVFSSLTLDSPSSYIKHQQLHDQTNKILSQFGTPHSMIRKQYKGISDIFQQLSNTLGQSNSPDFNIKTIISSHNSLPPLTLVYDYSHIKNYDDVYTQTRVQSVDEEAFSMGQIDALPTLSLIAGVPIPYGNLGVLKKELIPNQFVHQHHGRLTGAYSDDWTNMSQICSLFSTFNNNDDKIHIKIAELRHEIMILHLRVLNLGQVLRYSKDYTDTVKSFSGIFIQDGFVHTRVIWAKLAMIEDSITTLSQSCQNLNTSNLDTMSVILDTLYPAIIDTNQHVHLVLTHIKAGFTREWTQFDMANMYAGIITFGMLTFVVLFQFLRYILRARKNESLYLTNIQIETVPAGAHYRDNDNVSTNPFRKFFCFVCYLPFIQITNVWSLLRALIIYSGISTVFVSSIPVILFLCPSTWSELHFPIPKILIQINEMTANSVTFEEDPAALAQAVTTTQTSLNPDIYTIHIVPFLVTIFALTFFFFFTIYQAVQFWNTVKYTRTLPTPVNSLILEKYSWWKFFVVFAIIIGLLQGLFAPSFIDKPTPITHLCCLFLAGWALFAVNGSLRYYYAQMVNQNDEISQVDRDVHDDPAPRRFTRIPGRSNTRNQSTQDDDDEQDEAKPLVSRRGARSTQPALSDLPSKINSFSSSNQTQTFKLNSPFLQKKMVSPKQFLILSIIAFFCIALMSFEGELTDTNSKLLFNIPYQDHFSLVSWWQNLTNGGVGSALQTIYDNADNVLTDMTNFQLKTDRELKAEMLKKPKLIDALIHQSDGDHSHGHADHAGHKHQDNNDNSISTSSPNAKVLVEPQVDAKIDPSQVVKAALNMFSPDIALDGSYVRKESQVFLIVRDSLTKQVVLGAGELYKEEYYQSHKPQLHKFLIDKYQINGKSVFVESIIAEFPGTAVDTRSHYSNLHVVIVLVLFVTSLYVLGNYMMSEYTNAKDKTDFNSQLPYYIRFYNKVLIPVTACYVACYWLPTYISLLLQPLVQLALSIFGTCNNLAQHNLLLNPTGTSNTILSATDQLQLCAAAPQSMCALLVQVLRLYIPSLVYVTFILGIVLVIAFVFQFVRLRLNQATIEHDNKSAFKSMSQFYSSEQLLAFIFIVIFPTVCLVSGPRATVVYALYVVFLEICKRLVQTMFIVIPYNKQLVHLTNFAALFAFITVLMFHATGHAYSFNDIHIAAGFVGIPGYIFGVSEALVFFNTFGGFFFGTFGCLMFGYYTTTFYQKYKEETQIELDAGIESDTHLQLSNHTHTQYFLSFSRTIPIAWFMLWTFLRLWLCTINLHWQRRDLFVWALYAPYWLMIAIMSIINTLIVVVYTFSLPPEQKC